jgi:hypothetical protein
MDDTLSHLTFGTEFEVFFPGNRYSVSTARAELRRRTGFGWDVHADGSIRDENGLGSFRGGSGAEFVSPVLRGQDGLDQVATVVNALRDMGANVNSSCGFHVHVGVAENDLQTQKNLVKLYASYEREIDEVMPNSRRANNAGFCRSIASVNFASVDRARNWKDLVRAMQIAAGSGTDRYVKLNLATYDRDKPTVEFRQHSGTVDAVKAVNWIIRCLQLVTAAKAGDIGAGRQIARDYAHFAFKTRAVIEMISRPEGATTYELCVRVGARRMGVKRHARLAGFEYRKRGKRYFMVSNPNVTTVAAAPTTNLDDLLKATPEQREFWNGRRAALRR